MEKMMDLATKPECWNNFLIFKKEHRLLSSKELREMQAFVDEKRYLSCVESWENHTFPSTLPLRWSINKMGSSKKRVVYSYQGDEGLFLKFIAFNLFRYDHLFASNCYAFRRSIGVKDAIMRLRLTPDLSKKYCLKVDISNYFNSIDVNLLLNKLSFLREDDPALYELFEKILENDKVMDSHSKYDGKSGNLIIVPDKCHGAMAGTPTSAFFANLYLARVDQFFENEGILYFRYSDDILLFADTKEQLFTYREVLYDRISKLGLSVNPDKVKVSAPGEDFEFLGFSYRNGRIDLSPATIRKMKSKIKRKADALRRWQRKKGLTSDKAAIGLIKSMNHKFYGNLENDTDSNDFTWSRWFFPNLNTDKGLKEIDTYFQEYIRYTVTGRHYKGNYRISYEQLKEWGYKSLVHEYYEALKNGNV